MPLAAWGAMLKTLRDPPRPPGQRPDYVDWFALERREGREVDAGMFRHHLDPTQPFAMAVAAPAHGVLITSATLRDAGGEADADDPDIAWRAAEARTGVNHLPAPAIRAAVASPFDYASRTRAFVVTDVARDEFGQIAAAYRALFLAAGGGGLGLFTAVRRLREVHARIAEPLAAAGIPLYAQHMDAMDNATLVDVFRAEEASCLLGTDAMRDGWTCRPVAAAAGLRPRALAAPRPSCTGSGGPGSREGGPRPMTTPSPATGCAGLRAAGAAAPDDRASSCCSTAAAPSRLLAGLPRGRCRSASGCGTAVAATRSSWHGRGEGMRALRLHDV
jgi:ATP-dependent DNA helicase DinG